MIIADYSPSTCQKAAWGSKPKGGGGDLENRLSDSKASTCIKILPLLSLRAHQIHGQPRRGFSNRNMDAAGTAVTLFFDNLHRCKLRVLALALLLLPLSRSKERNSSSRNDSQDVNSIQIIQEQLERATVNYSVLGYEVTRTVFLEGVHL